MRVVFFGNHRVGLDTLRYLAERGDEIVGLIVHSPERARFRDEIVRASGLPPDRIWDGAALRQSGIPEAISNLNPEIGVSAFFGHILRADILDLFPAGVINLHPAYLPYNRGAFPNVWSIIDRTPTGVTLHYIDARVDTGDLIAQRQVAISPTDTGGSLYGRLERACNDLFEGTWPHIAAGEASRGDEGGGEGDGYPWQVCK